MTLTRWYPFREIDQLHREINRLFDSIDTDRWNSPLSRFWFLPGRSARSYPLLNVREDAGNIYVHAMAPGIKTDTLKISVVQNQLVIEGEKSLTDDGVKPEAYHRNERAAGKFVRTLTLPAEVDPEKVQAEYRNGLIRITLPKAEHTRPRQIKVSVN